MSFDTIPESNGYMTFTKRHDYDNRHTMVTTLSFIWLHLTDSKMAYYNKITNNLKHLKNYINSYNPPESLSSSVPCTDVSSPPGHTNALYYTCSALRPFANYDPTWPPSEWLVSSGAAKSGWTRSLAARVLSGRGCTGSGENKCMFRVLLYM